MRKPPAELHIFLSACASDVAKLFLATRRAVLTAAPDANLAPEPTSTPAGSSPAHHGWQAAAGVRLALGFPCRHEHRARPCKVTFAP
jgi:hypothetical protein